MTWTETWLKRGVGYRGGQNGDKNAYNLKKTVDSACDTDVAAAPNLLLPLSHFYPPLKCRALSVPSVLAKPVKQTAMEKLQVIQKKRLISLWLEFSTWHGAISPCIFLLLSLVSI